MPDNPLLKLGELGQSIWYDNIHREMLRSGELARLVAEDGLKGLTSNPTIFDKAITGGDAYRDALEELIRTDPDGSPEAYFFALAKEDIRGAADVLRPIYDETEGRDGFVSLEVSPHLAHDTEASIVEAHKLFEGVDRPNLMIKIPATRAGLPAIERLIADGLNINVTLLFSVERYVEVAHAYLRGLQTRQQRGEPIDRIASVASFFVSRVDTLLDARLEAIAEQSGDETARARLLKLRGTLAIANAKMAFLGYQEVFGSAQFEELASAGARRQRLLWASTGTKNKAYSDVLYVESLVAPNTVNTLPPATYNAFKDHGQVALTLEQGLDAAPALLEEAQQRGIDLPAAMRQLEDEGVAAFAASFDSLLEHIEAKVKAIREAA